MSEGSPRKIFLLSKKQCMELVEEAAFHGQLAAALLKNHDIINPLPEEETLLRKLCEYYMCQAGIKDLLEDFEVSRPSQYSKERESDDYVVTEEDGQSLQLMITATDVLKLELENYNISFTVH